MQSKRLCLKDYSATLCLGNVSKDFLVDNRKNNALYGYVSNFSVDSDSIEFDGFEDMHKCIMKSML